MNYGEFKQYVQEHIRSFLPEEYEKSNMLIRGIEKNKATKYALIIESPYGVNVCPSIYLEPFYDLYQRGIEMEEVLRKIAEARVHFESEMSINVDDITKWEFSKSKIVPRLVGASGNQKYLGKLVSLSHEDLRITFGILLEAFPGESGTIQLTHEIMENFPVTEEELLTIAVENMRTCLPVFFKSLDELVQERMTGIVPGQKEVPIYVLSNQSGTYGAAELLDSALLKTIHKKIGNFYILPSSVHEVILISSKLGSNVAQLRQMVYQVNRQEVQSEDVLSDSVYFYDGREEGFVRV